MAGAQRPADQTKTQWHNIVAVGAGFAQLGKGSLEEHTFSYKASSAPANMITSSKFPNGKKTVEHTARQLVIELRADRICVLDHSSNGEQSYAAEPPANEQAPEEGPAFL